MDFKRIRTQEELQLLKHTLHGLFADYVAKAQRYESHSINELWGNANRCVIFPDWLLYVLIENKKIVGFLLGRLLVNTACSILNMIYGYCPNNSRGIAPVQYTIAKTLGVNEIWALQQNKRLTLSINKLQQRNYGDKATYSYVTRVTI